LLHALMTRAERPSRTAALLLLILRSILFM
jgi:hypothetical protein